MLPSLPFPTIAQASTAIRARQISPLELTQICLQRIEAIDPQINAFITLTAESALAEARAATEEIAHGNYRGPLHGIPLAIKDLFDVRGVATTAGSPLLKDNVAQDDAFVVKQLREAGAIFLGKLNMHEWALGVTGVNPHFGAARNPWNTDTHHRRIEQRIGGGAGRRVVLRLVGIRHRRIDPHPGVVVRRRRIEAHLRARERARRDSAGVVAGSRRADGPLRGRCGERCSTSSRHTM